MKTAIQMFLMVVLVVSLWGCAALNPFSSPVSPIKKTTTTTDLDGNKTITSEESYPPEVSDAVAKMQKACFESFDQDAAIPDSVANKMESRDIKDVLIFKEYRMGLREARGFDPRQVCSSSKNIYDYAIAHDQALYGAIKHVVSTAGSAFKEMFPWFVVGEIAKSGNENAGSTTFGDDAQVSGSFNKPTAVNIGGQNSVVSAQPYEVKQPDPLVVEQVVVQ